MSGRLVGEVMDNVDGLRARGLSQRAVTALLVIAEGCRDDRLGRVSRARVAAVLGASERTASKALAELKDSGVVVVLERGNRRAGASSVLTLYRLQGLGAGPDPARVDVPDPDETPSGGPGLDGNPEVPVDDHRREAWSSRRRPVDNSHDENTGVPVDNRSRGSFGPIDGNPEVPATRRPVNTSRGYVTGERYVDDVPPVPPSRRCTIHHNATHVPACGACADARRAFEVWESANLGRLRTEAAARRSAVDACGRCDEYGWELGHDNLAVKCAHRPTLRVVGQ